MKERPILFSGPMVEAILAGRKVQTRRIMKQQTPPDWQPRMKPINGKLEAIIGGDKARFKYCTCPYGNILNQLWVRETWTISQKTSEVYVVTYKEDWDSGPPLTSNRIIKVSDMTEKEIEQAERFWKRKAAFHPSIHMPRWASRVQLGITAIRVERLQDITEDDSRAEGRPFNHRQSPKTWFRELWDSINASRDKGAYAWAANPWVWVIEFKQIKKGD